jgi:hypothetical protein
MITAGEKRKARLNRRALCYGRCLIYESSRKKPERGTHDRFWHDPEALKSTINPDY